jgi:hypothetical protein
VLVKKWLKRRLAVRGKQCLVCSELEKSRLLVRGIGVMKRAIDGGSNVTLLAQVGELNSTKPTGVHDKIMFRNSHAHI